MSDSESQSLELVCEKRLNFAEVLNPFEPTERQERELAWKPAKTVKDYLDESGVFERTRAVVVVLNGRVVEESEWSLTYPAEGDYLTAAAALESGGGSGDSGGSKVGRIFVTVVGIILSYHNPMLGMAFMAAMNYLMMPKPPETGASGTPTFGIDGPKNQSAEGIPVPVVYGRHALGGNIIALHTENDGDSQYLNMLLCAGEGPIADIDNIYINDQLAWTNNKSTGAFHNLQVAKRLGLHSQEPIDWFDDVIMPHYRGVRLNTDWLTHQTSDVVDKLRVDVLLPNGLVQYYSDGDDWYHDVSLQIQYRRVGDAEWLSFPPTAGTGEDLIAPAYEWSASVAYTQTSTEAGIVNTVPTTQYDNKAGTGLPSDQNRFTIFSSGIVVHNGDFESGTFGDVPVYVYHSGDAVPGLKAGGVWTQGDGVTVPLIGLSSNLAPFVAGSLTSRALWGFNSQSNDLAIGIRARQISPLRRSFSTGRLTRGRYEVRVRRVNAEELENKNKIDQVVLTDINEIRLEDFTYPNTALLGIRVRLSDQLSTLPKVTYESMGLLVPVYRDGEWVMEQSDNPAWVALDMITNRRYGGWLAEYALDMPKFFDWAAWCDEQNLHYRGVFYENGNLWDSLQLVFRCGRAQVVMQGTRLTVAIERAGTPSMMFSVGNIVEGSFECQWLPLQDRPNEVEVRFLDKDNGYEPRTIRVTDQLADELNSPPRPVSIDLPGVVDEERAYRDARMMLNAARYVTQSVKFEATIEAIGCTIGTLIYVQHDMPQWGYGGRLDRSSTRSEIKLDRPVAMIPDRAYRLLVHYGAIRRVEGTVLNIIDKAVYLSDTTDKGVKRIQVGDADLEVTGTFSEGVFVRSTAAISVGDAYSLWDTDAIEERDVVNSLEAPGEVEELLLASPLSAPPLDYANFMFGEVGKVKKPFRVTAIEAGSADMQRTIRAMEYNASVYDDTVPDLPTPNYSSLGISHVRELAVEEELVRIGTVVRARVWVRWERPLEGLYEGAHVYVSRDERPFEHVTTVRAGAVSYNFEADDGAVLRIRIIAVDALGRSALSQSAPEISYTVIGKLAPPANVQNFTATKVRGGIRLRWDAVPDLDLLGYELREGPSWEDGKTITEEFAGTNFLAERSDAGQYFFHIRAIDTSRNYSAEPTTVTISLIAPVPVDNFDCVQNGKVIYFQWDANPETDISSYEIREGVSWALGTRITRTDSISYTTTSDVPGDRVFWIKAIDIAGVYSHTAVFASTAIARSDDRNLVFQSDQVALNWSGVKFNTYVTPENYLNLRTENAYGEYLYAINLPTSYRARSVVNASLNAIAGANLTWNTATMGWDDAADLYWSKPGDLNSVVIRHEYSIYRGLSETDVEGFLFKNSLNGINGTLPTQGLGVTYAPGRFEMGVSVKDTTFAAWGLALPSTFKLSFWLMPEQVGDATMWSATGPNGTLTLGYRMRDASFYLEDDQGNRIVAPFVLAAGQVVLVAIVQTDAERKLFVGRPEHLDDFASAVLSLPPAGGYANVRLY